MDKDLLRRLKDRDPLAWKAVFMERHRALVGSLANQFRQQPLEAVEDAVMDAWKYVYVRGIDTFDGKLDISALIYVIAFRALARKSKEEEKRPHIDIADPKVAGADRVSKVELSSEEPRPEQHLSTKQNANAVNACIDQLPPRQRQAILLDVHSGLTRREIQGTLGMPEGTLKATLHAARKNIRSCLLKKGIDLS